MTEDRSQHFPRKLADGPAGVALVIDFSPFRATERLSELLAEQNYEKSVYEADPVRDLVDGGRIADLSALATEYAANLLASRMSAEITVIAHCSAAALGLEVAGVIRATRPQVRIVLVQPTWPTRTGIAEDFARFLDDVGTGPRTPSSTDDSAELNIGGMRDALTQQMRTSLEIMGNRGGPLPAPYQELLDRYVAWLHFSILTCEHIEATEPSDQAVDVVTDERSPVDHPLFERATLSVVRLPVAEDELLRAAELPQAVLLERPAVV